MTGFEENSANEAKSVVSREVGKLETQLNIKCDTRIIKTLNKSYGKNLGFNIAFGRRLLKLLKEQYASNTTT